MARRRETYSERIARGVARGLSRSQARGHARPFERSIRAAQTNVALDDRLIKSLRVFRTTNNASLAAKTAHVSRERFSRFLRDQGVATRQGRAWTITDNLVREVDMISQGRRQVVRVRGFDAASTIELHNAAVRRFLFSRDLTEVAAFEGWSVTDTAGVQHPLETRPNVLLRLALGGGDGFEAVYRIII